MANIDQVQLPDGSNYNIVDNTSGFATQNYVDSAVSSVTKTTIGLGNVDNTSDLNKPISTATQAALNTLDEDKADKTDIATVESGTTASRAYSVGELVYVSGTLYKVKTAIASGATFTVGTNIEVTNVSNALNNNSTELLSLANCEGWYTSRVSKSGNIVNVQLSIHLTVSQSTGAVIVASVPLAYKPVDPVVAFPKVNSSGQPSFGFLQKSDSRIYIYPTEANEYLTANFSYLAE